MLLALLAVLSLGGCRSAGNNPEGDAAPGAGPEAPAAAPEGATPKSSPEAVVQALLAAEQAADHATSYRLLSSQGRRDLDEAGWARRRTEVPAITGFRIEASDGPTVVAVVEHEPGLDPFVGLRPGRERQTWQARPQGGGWLVDAEPVVEPDYPPPEAAGEAALAWARAVQACDRSRAAGHEAVTALFGQPDAAAGLCGTSGALTAGPAEPAPPGPQTADLVAQFGPETLSWARTVAISGALRPFSVVLAPIGSVWKVVAVLG
ncbi:MAG TPA: hypothetical protein VM264_01010 [Acidimicrobiales bacterium]|nr:hypothetical protein [Acidimicrobiales bacterium]